MWWETFIEACTAAPLLCLARLWSRDSVSIEPLRLHVRLLVRLIYRGKTMGAAPIHTARSGCPVRLTAECTSAPAAATGPRLRSLALEITRQSTNSTWTTQQWQQSIRDSSGACVCVCVLFFFHDLLKVVIQMRLLLALKLLISGVCKYFCYFDSLTRKCKRPT